MGDDRSLRIPPGTAASGGDDAALLREREEMRRRLLNGEPVMVDPDGALVSPAGGTQSAIYVPPGKLASFYWYQQSPDVLAAEQEAMRRFFPSFQLRRESDGRLSWVGRVRPGLMGRKSRRYFLQAVYEHSHPSNDTYGGSIKVYSIEPDLNSLAAMTNGRGLPHTLRDSANQLYICTARPEDFRAGAEVTTAASALAWAVKWLGAFELWLDGCLSDADFRGHLV